MVNCQPLSAMAGGEGASGGAGPRSAATAAEPLAPIASTIPAHAELCLGCRVPLIRERVIVVALRYSLPRASAAQPRQAHRFIAAFALRCGNHGDHHRIATRREH